MDRKKLNSDLQGLQTWITKSRMRLHVQKSSVMWFSPKKVSTSISILVNGNPLQEVEAQKYLGIIFDNKLHKSIPCQKASYYLA